MLINDKIVVSGWEGKITTFKKKNYQQKTWLNFTLCTVWYIFRFKFPCITYVSYIGLYITPLVHTVQYSPSIQYGRLWPTRGKLKQTNFTDSHKDYWKQYSVYRIHLLFIKHRPIGKVGAVGADAPFSRKKSTILVKGPQFSMHNTKWLTLKYTSSLWVWVYIISHVFWL